MTKYIVEVVCVGESKAAEIRPGRARAKALMILRAWRDYGAKRARARWSAGI